MAKDGSVVIDTELNGDGLKSGFSKLGSIAGTACKGVVVAIGTVATAFAGLVTASVNARGELEQQIGGVKKLFTTEMGDASQTVIDNANKAYKSAGLSAVDYMSTVTGFSASLISSLGGDTEKAAKIADRAIIDMSDNANTFGTDIASIQVAYQGFAKQNYTMLDNLKLGYGGTKTEMERLVKDASKMKDLQKELNVEVKEGDLSFANIAQAITVVQKNLGVLGTTEKEASETLQGSLSAMKASWENFLSGSGDLSQVVATVTDVVTNIVRIVNEAIPQIIDNLTQSLPEFLQLGVELLSQIITGIITYLPTLMESAGEIMNTLMQGIIDLIPQLVPVALQVIQMLVTGLISYLPQILEMGVKILVELINGIAQMLPQLIPMAIDCIITLVETLLDNIDQLIDAGINILLALIDGIIYALPILIEKAPEIIQKLIDALIRNFPKIVQAGGELIGKLIAGIVGAFWKLLEVAPQLIANIVNGLKQGWEEVKNVGKYLIEGLWNGISGMASWVADKVKGFASNIVNNMKNALGIHSPSKVFADEIGKYLGLGLGEGFEDSLNSVYKEMENAVEQENAKLSTNLTHSSQIKVEYEDKKQSTLQSIDDNKEITVNTTTNLDGKVLTKSVNKVNSTRKLQYGY